jgi:antitoxin FitA
MPWERAGLLDSGTSRIYYVTMTDLIIRISDDTLKHKLGVRAAVNNRSMEAEAAAILERALNAPPAPRNMALVIRQRALRVGGIELDIDPRQPMPKPPSFE